jgi:hypothetical protein
MSPLEAIQNEIEREQAELARLDEELARTLKKTRPLPQDIDVLVGLVERIVEIFQRQLDQEPYEEEIRGKQELLKAAQENPDNPTGAIAEFIDEETRAAHKLGRRAQRLREEAWRDEQAGNDAEAQKKRDEAKKLGDQHRLQLARLRGKIRAGREVQRVLQSHPPK